MQWEIHTHRQTWFRLQVGEEQHRQSGTSHRRKTTHLLPRSQKEPWSIFHRKEEGMNNVLKVQQGNGKSHGEKGAPNWISFQLRVSRSKNLSGSSPHPRMGKDPERNVQYLVQSAHFGGFNRHPSESVSPVSALSRFSNRGPLPTTTWNDGRVR